MTTLLTSQIVAEVLRFPTAPSLQVSQLVVEVIQGVPPPALQTSQVAVEVLRSNAKYTPTWLQDPAAIRIMLFEIGVCVGGVETTRYLSSGNYVTSPWALPANQPYLPVVTGGLSITESLPFNGDASLSVGDIAIDNASGARDSWLNDIWVNRPCKVWLGDPRWERGEFHLIFSGVNADIGSSDRNTLNLTLSNKLQRLNTAITDIKLGGDCAYTQSGTTVTVTKINHGRRITSPLEVHVSSGAAVSGSYAVLATPTADTFTYTAGTSVTAAGLLTLGGLNADATIPIALGETHNITPLLTDAVSLEYQCHGGAMQSIAEVRDNGKPVPVTAHNSTGKFELLEPPVGAITVSVQGDSPGGIYGNTVAQLVQRIATGYGVAANRFSADDLDTASLSAFDAAHPQPVGLFVTDRSNVLTLCQQLAASLGAQMAMSRTGLLRLLQLSFPPSGTPVAIPRSAQIDRTLHIVGRSSVTAAVRIGYCRNWTVQPGLLTTIPAAHKDSFADQWWTVTSVDAAVQAQYQLGAEPVQQDTLLLTRFDAQAEADRRLARDKAVRTTYQFEGTATQLALELGQAVTLFSSRFGLTNGALGIVTSLAPNWQTCHVIVEVTI